MDHFVDFSNIITPPTFFFNFPSVLSEEAAELEWVSELMDDELAESASIGSNNHRNDYNNHKSSSLSPPLAQKSRVRREGLLAGDGGVRRCSHCASEKTPQWRTGPLGPKTLCNACGVRFKSGRLVPEYRPAASPTFVLTQHSNSHRKVMELRRQKELLRQQEQCHPHTLL